MDTLFVYNSDVIIVGAGISGITAARLFAERGYKVVVIEKREEIGGNTFDYIDENGILVQKYGPHIFHTNEKRVFDFLSQFTSWEKYEHRVLGNINGKLVPIPFNLTSLFELFDREDAESISKILIEEFGLGNKVPILKLKQHSEETIRSFSQFVYQNVFYTYTMKQWGFKPEELGEAVMNRVPVYISYEDRYFTDEYQYMPTEGFTVLAKNILNHDNITVIAGVDALDYIEIVDDNIFVEGKPYFGKVVYTGQIEQLFNLCFGRLKYRSLDFVKETHQTSSYQSVAVVNYNTSEKYTRISEFSKFCCKPKEKTVIIKEYSKDFKEGDIPYYPIPKKENKEEYVKYLNEANKVENLYLLGRLARYEYINMDTAVLKAMQLVDEIENNNI